MLQCSDEFGKQLRQLNDLHLDISEIKGSSSVYRYCNPETIPPRAKRIEEMFRGHAVHDLIIQLGLSGKWPSELTSLRSLKTAFYIQIAEKLRH